MPGIGPLMRDILGGRPTVVGSPRHVQPKPLTKRGFPYSIEHELMITRIGRTGRASGSTFAGDRFFLEREWRGFQGSIISSLRL